jgi:Leucine-rich repeat (LRR) protein
VQVDPIKPKSKPPGTKRSKLKIVKVLSTSAFKINLRRYIGGLTALKDLRLNRNRLTSVPAELGMLTSLEDFRLNRNQLTSVPAALGGLTALEDLRLNRNRLTSVPKQLGNLTALTSLNLGNNPDLAPLPEEVEQLSTTHGGITNIKM